MKKLREHYVVVFAVTAMVTACGAASAANPPYPAKSVRMIVPFAPGGTTDVLGRLIGQRLSAALQTPVVVENKPGAGGNVLINIKRVAYLQHSCRPRHKLHQSFGSFGADRTGGKT